LKSALEELPVTTERDSSLEISTWPDATDRASRSGGASETAIYAMVADALRHAGITFGILLDIGCGSGNLYPFVHDRVSSYVGVDLVRYDGFPARAEWIEANLDQLPLPLSAGCADVVTAIETIEHLENPRAFMRELVRLAKPGGTVVVTTPNQLSLLSKMTLMLKNRFCAFQDVHYPAHITALLEIDLIRIASACGLQNLSISYSNSGRIVFTPLHYPRTVSRRWPRAMSDNICLTGTKA
jgi:2-polyprenyl-3-methyl-5-hydroxy-6-metoxy-1,4-benzoquinol methylase